MIAQARITLPPPQPGLIARPDLDAFLDRPIIVLSAGAGFGKSQLLTRWAHAVGTDARLTAYALCSRLGETPASLLELLFTAVGCQETYLQDTPWQQQIDQLLERLFEKGPVRFLVDDLHHLETANSDTQGCLLLLSYLLDYRPPDCQLILSGRSTPELADLGLREMRGDLAVIKSHQLALTAKHLEELSPNNGNRLFDLTSGWPLAAAVLMRHPQDRWDAERDNLSTSLLRMATTDLSPRGKDAVNLLGLMSWATRAEIRNPEIWDELTTLAQEGLLVHPLDKDRLQLHPLFSEQSLAGASDALRAQAIEGLLQTGRAWEALELTRSPEDLRDRLLVHGDDLLRAGRLHLLEGLLHRTSAHPVLSRIRGDVAWRLGDPSAAIAAYTESARLARSDEQNLLEAQAWSAAAGLYLDAVCPLQANQYLKKAYRALSIRERREKAKILGRFAENAVNQGNARQSARYRRLAARWDDQTEEDFALTSRLLLRSGRLAEARAGLETALEHGLAPSPEDGVLEGHREPRLVLSYIHSHEGRHEQALSLATVVLDQARRLKDRLTEAVALTRIAHARLVGAKAQVVADPEEILALYTQADTLIRSLGVERLRVEMLMGQALYHQWLGHTPRALEAVLAGIDLAQKSGDRWLKTWLELVYACILSRDIPKDATTNLGKVRENFRRCRDRFGFALAEVWMSALSESGAFDIQGRKALEEFPFLATRPTLFGPPPGSVNADLPVNGPVPSPRSLQVFCLGSLSLLRDGEPVPTKAFKRKKARELLVILLTAPDSFFHREDLAAQLWPQADQKAALRDFRVALHALSDALEPEREKNSIAFCLDRQEERYRLLSEKVDLDAQRFEQLCRESQNNCDIEAMERAFKLYRGPFCEDYPYLDALVPVRQKYDRLALNLAQSLATAYLERAQPAKAVELAQRILGLDATWEPAYRLMMRGQSQMGHEHLLPRTFTLCLETLEEELGVEPSEETFALARELLGDQMATIL